MGQLEGKTALVTGGALGIGLAVAQRFAREGARVVLADRNGEGAVAAAAAIGDAARAVTMDISDEDAVAAAFAELEADGWAPDVVVANAGVQLFGQDAPAADLDLDVWRRTIDINLTGTFLTVKHAVQSMLRSGAASGPPAGRSSSPAVPPASTARAATSRPTARRRPASTVSAARSPRHMPIRASA